MRIPTSVIVMSLVTAAPFALAVRDTLRPHQKHLTLEEQRAADVEAEMQRMEAEQEATHQAEEARKQAVMTELLGEPGKLGGYLDHVTIGAARAQVEAVEQRIAPAMDLVDLAAEYDAEDKVSSLKVVAGDCDALREAVRTHWGEDVRWVDTAAHVKTTFVDGDDCAIEQHPYVDMNQFLDRSMTASIPLAALGKPSSALLADDGALHRPGLAQTDGVTLQVTTDDAAKIVGMSASFAADVEADALIRARLDALLGKGAQDPDTGEWAWKGKTPVHYAYTDAHGYLDIGTP